jgi:dTDP-4-amino-4,6-dideoxygalactose transaminase
VIRTIDREGLMSHLKEADIGVGIHYPIPLHLQKAYASLNYNPGDLPVTESIAGEILSLPMFPQLSSDQQERVVEQVQAFTSRTSRKETGSEEKTLTTVQQTA